MPFAVCLRQHARIALVDLELLHSTLHAQGQPRFRAAQVWAWAARGATGYEQMTDLPIGLRSKLAEEVPFCTLELQSEHTAGDGTEKALFSTEDGQSVEAVLMRYRDGRRSVCLSSQSGCPLTCRFCATGQMKFARNLSFSEIVDQALHFRRKERIDHAVFMGMGEPLINAEAVCESFGYLRDIGIPPRHVAVSTVGWLPGIERLAQSPLPVRLALSVHAADESLRSELMPVNHRYPLWRVLEACRDFARSRKQRVFVEYLMLSGVNDRYEQALELASILEPKKAFKVNLIPYNPSGGPFEGSSERAIAVFRDALSKQGLQATVRLTRGRDIDAACGQLAARQARPDLSVSQAHPPIVAS
jgi:23S rRNA (adenine2503-C2)-methyltransferase